MRCAFDDRTEQKKREKVEHYSGGGGGTGGRDGVGVVLLSLSLYISVVDDVGVAAMMMAVVVVAEKSLDHTIYILFVCAFDRKKMEKESFRVTGYSEYVFC